MSREKINRNLAEISVGELFQLTVHYGGYFRMYFTKKNKPVGIVVVAGDVKMSEVDRVIKELEKKWEGQVQERSAYLS